MAILMTGGLGGVVAGNKKCNRNCISSLTASPPCLSRHSQKVQLISFIFIHSRPKLERPIIRLRFCTACKCVHRNWSINIAGCSGYIEAWGLAQSSSLMWTFYPQLNISFTIMDQYGWQHISRLSDSYGFCTLQQCYVCCCRGKYSKTNKIFRQKLEWI